MGRQRVSAGLLKRACESFTCCTEQGKQGTEFVRERNSPMHMTIVTEFACSLHPEVSV